MTLVKQGNALTTKFVQPGGTYTDDGYGMMTGKVTYFVDKTVGGTAVITGQVHPGYTDFYVHKFSLSKGAMGIDTIQAEYVGVKTPLERTLPNVTASLGLTSEHITTHPNFFGPTAPFTVAIAGNGTTFTSSSIVTDEKVGGVFGAHFKGTTSNAGNFVGFKDSSTAAKQYFYGKTHYLSPITSFSGTIYTTLPLDVTTIRDAVGKTSGTNSFGAVKLLPDHLGATWTVTIKGSTRNTILLSQASFEDYCVDAAGAPKIVKINYEIRFNREGYPAEVYAPVV
jgi:hypothetical protein